MKESFVENSKKQEKIEKSKNKEATEIKNEDKDPKLMKEETKFKKMQGKHQKIEKEMKKTNNIGSKKKYIIISISIIILLVMGIFISTIFALININNKNIVSGVSISGIEVSGLSKDEAKAKLETVYQEKMEKELHVKYEEYENSLNLTLMEVNYNIDKSIDEAYLIGRKENIFFSNYDILFSLIAKKDINVEMTLNEEATKQMIEDMGVSLPGVVIESSYAVEDDELVVTKGKSGVKIDTDKLLEKVKDKLNNINSNDDYLEIPVVNKEPEIIDLDKIHNEICKEAQDAYYTKEPFAVYPEVNGVSFDLEAAKALLAEEKEEYVIKLTITKPKVTIDQIGSEAFPDRLSTFTTRYDVSDVNRTQNLIIACQKMNGKVLLVGETFSYNQTLGPRTAAAGYRNGKIYSGGKVVDGIGGGICQISSTLYNAVLLANLDIVERRNHQFVTSYLGAGRDATVVYGAIDFRFKNTRKYPVKIQASAKNGIATVSIYGIKEENEYDFKFSTKTVATIPYSTQYIEDNTLEIGKEVVEQKGANGIKTQTYITKMLNGKVISTKLLSADTYSAMVRIVRKGTKAVVNTTPVPDVMNQEPSVPEVPTDEPVQDSIQTPVETPTDTSQETPNTGTNLDETIPIDINTQEV